MRIGISTRGLNQGTYAISSIVYHLSQKIIKMATDRHEIFLYINDPAHHDLFDGTAHKRVLKMANRFIWDQVWLPQAIRKDCLDITLFMKGTMPTLLPGQGAVIFHDLGYFDDKLRPYKYFDTLYMKYMMRRAARRAYHIFADSEFTRAEAIRIFGIKDEKISVCYQNCDPIFKPIGNVEHLKTIQARYQLPNLFMFCPVSLSPRKNLGRILDAFTRIQSQIPHQIVITGGKSWREQEFIRRIENEFSHRMRILGELPQEDMPALYNLADFTIYPSLLEGFGLPVLEAFRCNCPVLTSSLTSIPEVAGKAAYLVDPYDTAQIAEGMFRLANDGNLRRELSRRGRERAKLFSWDRTAKIILERLEQMEETGKTVASTIT